MFVDAAAGRRPARARARGARVRPARARAGLAHRAAVGEGRAGRAVRARRLPADAVRPGGVRRARLVRASRRGWRRCWPARSASPRWAWRSARSRARCAPRRCWRSCCRCRSRSSRSCRPARSTSALYDVINGVSALFPFKPALRALDAAINGGGALLAAAAPAGAHARASPRSPGWRCAASRLTALDSEAMAFPATRLRRLRAHRAAARARARDRAGGRRTSSTRCSWSPAASGARRSRSMPGIDHLCIDGAVEEAGDRARARDPGRAAVRPAGRQGRAGLGRLGRRGRDPARHARDQGRASRPAGDRRPVPVRVHEPRPLRRAARRTAWSTTTRRSSCSPAPRSPRPRPAPTPSRRAT